MRFWNNSVKKAKLSHTNLHQYYFTNPKSGTTYLLGQDLRNGYHFEICPKNDDIFDEWETSQENIDALLSKINEFNKHYENAKQEQDGFVIVRLSEIATLYYKRLQKATYHFILDCNDEHEIYNVIAPAKKFVQEHASLIVSLCNINKDDFANENSPFYLSAKNSDEYLAAEIEYFCGKVTPETVAILNTVRDNPVFFAENQIYDISDITEIKDVERGPIGFFNRRAHYSLQVFIRDRFYKAWWVPIKKELRMNCCESYIEISDTLHEKIQYLTGETPGQTKIRKLIQLENYHYGYKDGLSRLPTEMRERIFEKMGQASLEDLKSLPLLHLKRLTVAQLYDWLHCSGNTGDLAAVEFVEDLAKSRKEKYQY